MGLGGGEWGGGETSGVSHPPGPPAGGEKARRGRWVRPRPRGDLSPGGRASAPAGPRVEQSLRDRVPEREAEVEPHEPEREEEADRVAEDGEEEEEPPQTQEEEQWGVVEGVQEPPGTMSSTTKSGGVSLQVPARSQSRCEGVEDRLGGLGGR